MRLIDADALKEEVNKKNVIGRFNTLLLIDNAPTVETSIEHFIDLKALNTAAKTLEERPQGVWIKTIYDFYICSLCNEYGNPNYYKFCPYCGAKMENSNKE